MNQPVKKTITVSTPRHQVKIDCYYATVPVKEIVVQKEKFAQMCKDGCANYGNKYSCPPFAPEFFSYIKNSNYLFVVALLVELDQFKQYRPYHRLRIGNAVIKTRIEKVMRQLEAVSKTKFLSTGSCRLCRPCRKKINQPCQHPDLRRYSLEALGVDCNHLMEKTIGKSLLWYKNKNSPAYTTVICALPYQNKSKAKLPEKTGFILDNLKNF